MAGGITLTGMGNTGRLNFSLHFFLYPCPRGPYLMRKFYRGPNDEQAAQLNDISLATVPCLLSNAYLDWNCRHHLYLLILNNKLFLAPIGDNPQVSLPIDVSLWFSYPADTYHRGFWTSEQEREYGQCSTTLFYVGFSSSLIRSTEMLRTNSHLPRSSAPI